MRELTRVGTPLQPDPAAAARARHGHYAALDGLRGFALLVVFAGHFYGMTAPAAAIAWCPWFGVDLFFVLSGFLITGILFDSLRQPRFFRNFYIRRALRIFPLYYAPWIVFLILTPWLHPLWTRFDIARVFYYGNLMQYSAARHPEIQFGGFMFHLPGGHLTGFNTGPLWSLCLEEQFYLFLAIAGLPAARPPPDYALLRHRHLCLTHIELAADPLGKATSVRAHFPV